MTFLWILCFIKDSIAIVVDKLIREIQDELPWCMLFADDIILIDETRVGVYTKLERRMDTLEAKGFTLSRSKAKYSHCRFNAAKKMLQTKQPFRVWLS